MTDIPSTSGRLHSEFVRFLFLQTHRETDRFFAASGVQFTPTDRDQFHFRLTDVSVQLKSRVGLALAKEAALRITLNLDGAPITSMDSSPLGFSLSSHRHSYIGLVFSSLFID